MSEGLTNKEKNYLTFVFQLCASQIQSGIFPGKDLVLLVTESLERKICLFHDWLSRDDPPHKPCSKPPPLNMPGEDETLREVAIAKYGDPSFMVVNSIPHKFGENSPDYDPCAFVLTYMKKSDPTKKSDLWN